MKFYRLIFSFCLLINSAVAISQDTRQEDSTDKIFEKIEVEAAFPGGPQGWRKYLEKNLNAMVTSDNGAPVGKYTVLVKFIVTRNGDVTDIKPITKMGFGMEQEVVRIIKNSGKWQPGAQNGRAVNSYHTQPVTFVLEEDGFDIRSIIRYVLFAGVNNELTINVDNIKPENLVVTISIGKITPAGDGKFIARVTDTAQRAVITVYNSKKNNKEIGAVSFEVKPQREAPDAIKQ